MKLTEKELEGGVLKVVLKGAMDIAGSAEADLPFRKIAEARKRVVIDLGGVDFLASIGIRVLVKTAKAIAENGGRMSVYNAQDAAARVLGATGVDRVINLVADEAAAVATVSR